MKSTSSGFKDTRTEGGMNRIVRSLADNIIDSLVSFEFMM